MSTSASSHGRVQWAVFTTKPRPPRSSPNEPVSMFPLHKDTQAHAAREQQDRSRDAQNFHVDPTGDIYPL